MHLEKKKVYLMLQMQKVNSIQLCYFLKPGLGSNNKLTAIPIIFLWDRGMIGSSKSVRNLERWYLSVPIEDKIGNKEKLLLWRFNL